MIEWYCEDPLSVIEARLTVEEGAGPGRLDVSGQLRIQVCDAEYCYPPQRLPVTVSVTVI